MMSTVISHPRLRWIFKQSIERYVSQGLISRSTESFVFSSVSLEGIKKTIISVRSNAMGCDGISSRMIVTILDCNLPLTLLISPSTPVLSLLRGARLTSFLFRKLVTLAF